jgi:phospholipid transport system substrate-binding protein
MLYELVELEAPMFRALTMVVLLVTLALATPSLSAAPPGDPEVQKPIDTLDAALLEAMKAGTTLGFAARVQKLDPAIRQAFDLPYMAQIMAGRFWVKITDPDRTRYIEAFSRWTVATYASNFKAYDGESFETVGQEDTGKIVWVRTQLKIPNKDPVSLNYVMHRNGANAWQAADVFYNGSISEVARRRSEFQEVIAAKKIDGLIAMLEEKTKQLANPKPGS